MLEDMKIQDDNKEFDIAKYAPVIKAVAALGVGLASDSPMARGISEGLAKSAKSDMERRRLQEEVQREQKKLEAEARQKKLKTELDLIWKVGQDLSPIAWMKYADQTNFWSKSGIQRPDDPEEPVNLEALDISDAIQTLRSNAESNGTLSENRKAFGMSQLGIAGMLTTEGKYDQARLALKEAGEYLDPPKFDGFKLVDGKVVGQSFNNVFEATEAGYIYQTPAAALGRDPDGEYVKRSEGAVKVINKSVDSYNSTLSKVGQVDDIGRPLVEGYPFLDNFLMISDQATNISAQAGIYGSTPLMTMRTPFPSLLMDSYDVMEAGKVIRRILNSGVHNLSPTDPAALKQAVLENISEIKDNAKKRRSADGDYKIIEDTTTAPAVETTIFSPDDEELIQGWMELDGMTREQAEEKLRSL